MANSGSPSSVAPATETPGMARIRRPVDDRPVDARIGRLEAADKRANAAGSGHGHESACNGENERSEHGCRDPGIAHGS